MLNLEQKEIFYSIRKKLDDVNAEDHRIKDVFTAEEIEEALQAVEDEYNSK